ncbi:MAG TPA: rhamnulokinase family protein [Clostridia bacterium]|nr:rhamnulokinase family protein [Clostridia bacterium]
MESTINFVAVDLGASSGRLVVGRWNGTSFVLEELHRFANAGVKTRGNLHWDVLRLWSEIKLGLAKYAAKYETRSAGISVDTWGVDFALLDHAGRLLDNPHHYRDPRTEGMPGRAFTRVPRAEVFRQTGIQSLQINTVFQLLSMALSEDARLAAANHLLMMPDLFHYWLSGEKANEYTISSTTQMLDCRRRDWARGMIADLDIPSHFLGPIVTPGTTLERVCPDVLRECGFNSPFPVIAGASHDTASAVAAVPFLSEDSAFISSGTWSLMGVEVKQPITSEHALSLDFTNEGGVGGTIRLLKNITGLWLLQECLQQWQREGREYAWEQVLAIARKARPLRSIVDPDSGDFLSPEDMPKAIRNYCSRTDQPIPQNDGELARCCMESLALKYRSVLQALNSLTGRKLEAIRIVGGGSRNELLCQFTADACELPVYAGPVEASSLGNVMMQAVATGHLDSVATGRERIAASCELVTYEPGCSGDWNEAYTRFESLGKLREFI